MHIYTYTYTYTHMYSYVCIYIYVIQIPGSHTSLIDSRFPRSAPFRKLRTNRVAVRTERNKSFSLSGIFFKHTHRCFFTSWSEHTFLWVCLWVFVFKLTEFEMQTNMYVHLYRCICIDAFVNVIAYIYILMFLCTHSTYVGRAAARSSCARHPKFQL